MSAPRPPGTVATDGFALFGLGCVATVAFLFGALVTALFVWIVL